MAYNETVNFPPQSREGQYAIFNGGNDLLMSQLFSGTPQHYPGSTVRCQEIITVNTQVYDSQLVGRDIRWYSPKEYLGNYRILIDFLQPTFFVEDSGFIETQTFKIRRYSEYTVTANPDVPIALGEQAIVDNCNFQLKTDNFFFGGVLISGSTLLNNQAVFKTQESLTKVDLQDTVFNRRLKGIGVFLAPGVEIVDAKYTAAVINEIRILSAPFPSPSCSVASATCSQQFDNFLDQNPNDAFLSLSTCQSVTNVGCVLDTWECPTDSSQTFNYYRPTPN